MGTSEDAGGWMVREFHETGIGKRIRSVLPVEGRAGQTDPRAAHPSENGSAFDSRLLLVAHAAWHVPHTLGVDVGGE